MEEKNFLAEGAVTVTNARFIAGEQTFAMSGVTSVKSLQKNPSRILPGILGFIAIAAFVSGSIIGGIIFAAGAAAAWFLMKPTYSVLLFTASGETNALSSKDGEFINRVVGAVNNAIVHRG